MSIDKSCAEDNMANAVLSVLQYYKLFNYPLKAEEIYGNMALKCCFSEMLVALEDMEEAGKIHRYEGYYGLDDSVRENVIRRKDANMLASIKKNKALKVGRFIYSFPFVRFVGISGSLSKGYADQKSDFDFFIVAAENRLWICRTLLHLFKKLTFIAGQQGKFCMNYFIDTYDMELAEQNRFTAIELSSMIPVAGYEVYNGLMKSNNWLTWYLPNGFVGFDDKKNAVTNSRNILKTACEAILNTVRPKQLNTMLMNVTDIKWRKKWAAKNYPADEYDIAFKTTVHVSKNHPANHQKRILKAISAFENKNFPHDVIG